MPSNRCVYLAEHAGISQTMFCQVERKTENLVAGWPENRENFRLHTV